MSTTNIEKENLEAHVELCAERYAVLAERYATLQAKLDSLGAEVKTLEGHMVFIRETIANSSSKQSKQLITIGTSLLGVLLGGMITLIVTLFNKV